MIGTKDIEVRNTSDFSDYLDLLLARTESSDLEFKSAKGGFPGSFWDTYYAFANTDGGTIVLGVAEKGHRFFIDALSEELVEKYRKDFWNNVNNKSTISCNLMKTEDVVIGNYRGHKFMLFFVPRASREQRPVYRTTQPYNGTFKRDYEGDYKCTEKEVQRMFADADTSRPADSRILRNYSMDDIDKNSVDQFRRLFALSKPSHPWLAESDFDLIRKLGGYRKDRATGEEGFTLAGLLMFGKTEAITDNECCPNFFPDYQEKLSDDPNERWTNRLCPDGTWEANLFQFYKTVLPRLQAALPKPFHMEDNIRRDETPAHVAIREALINLCVHADYSENASLVVRLYKHRIFLSNPGTMLVSRQQYYEGGDSVCRNKALQTMFMMLGTAEKAGSGVDKILKGWKEANWRAPIITTKGRPDKVELTMSMESLMDEETQGKLIAMFGEDILNVGHERLLVLTTASNDGFVTNESLRFVLNIHKAEISDLLKDMCKAKLLLQEGYGRGTKYRIPKVASTEGKVASTEGKVASTEGKVASSEGKVASSEGKVARPEEMVSRPECKLYKKRLSAQQMTAVLIDIASDWVSLEEIANMLGKDKQYLRNKVIPKLLSAHKIEMMFPGVPKHPNQRYKRTDII